MQIAEHAWFASCPKGMEALLAHELSTLGADSTRETVAGVYFDGALATAYSACLWSRLANRILMPLGRYEVSSADDLYRAVHSIEWGDYFGVGQSFAIDFSGHKAEVWIIQVRPQSSDEIGQSFEVGCVAAVSFALVPQYTIDLEIVYLC